MAAPIISWRLADNSGEFTKWSIGKVDAGQESAQQSFLIWNNYNGKTEVAHMQDVKLTTTDGASDTLDVVTGKWIYTRCDSAGKTEFTQVGGETKIPLKAKTAEAGIIEGIVNTGQLTDEKSFAKVTAFFKSELHGVAAGIRNFKFRAEYFYV